MSRDYKHIYLEVDPSTLAVFRTTASKLASALKDEVSRCRYEVELRVLYKLLLSQRHVQVVVQWQVRSNCIAGIQSS